MSVQAQATAVERAFISVRGHRDVIADLVSKGRRPSHELAILEQWLVDLEPAAATMKWLAANEVRIKSALDGPREAQA